MDAAQFFQQVTQLGLGGIAVFLWYMDQKEIKGLAAIVEEQIADKKAMRQERGELIRIVEESCKTMQRATTALENLERRARGSFSKRR